MYTCTWFISLIQYRSIRLFYIGSPLRPFFYPSVHSLVHSLDHLSIHWFIHCTIGSNTCGSHVGSTLVHTRGVRASEMGLDTDE